MPLLKEEIKNLKFHIGMDDYFGTLATTLNCMAQEKKLPKAIVHDLYSSVDNLMHLQENYKIVPKKDEPAAGGATIMDQD